MVEILNQEVSGQNAALQEMLATLARKHAIAILQALAQAPEGLRFKDFVILVGGNPSVAQHSLRALVGIGWLSKDEKYRLTTEGRSWLSYYHRNPLLRQKLSI
jgi:DNA-binding IclR family transcriptional regulator